ncbi:hypothetical protein [Synergistes jonesii]|nr:hypothetical protein [Synergistes jonesii]
MIIDIQESAESYRLGDIAAFTLRYQAMLFSTENPFVEKRFVS